MNKGIDHRGVNTWSHLILLSRVLQVTTIIQIKVLLEESPDLKATMSYGRSG